MSEILSFPEYELLAESNLNSLTEMTIELWPDCDFYEEKYNWNQLIGDHNHFIELVKIHDCYIGFLHLTIRHDYVEGAEHDRVAYLEGIYIKSQFRNKGIAKQLLVHAENWCKSIGLRQIASDTEITNSVGHDFHQRMGFLEVNRIVCYIKSI